MLFERDLAAGAKRSTARDGTVTLELPQATTIGATRLGEEIAHGQRVARYVLEGDAGDDNWRTLAAGTTIGYAKLDRFAPTAVRRVRLRMVESIGTPGRVTVALYGLAGPDVVR